MASVILLLLTLYDNFGKHKRLLNSTSTHFSCLTSFIALALSVPLQVQKWLTFQECHFVNFSKLLRTPCHLLRRLAGHSLLSFPTSFQEGIPSLWNLCSFSYFFSQASLGAGVSGFPHCNKIFSSAPLWKVSQVLALVDLQYIITQWMNVIIFISGSLETSDVSYPSIALGLWWLFLQIALWSRK